MALAQQLPALFDVTGVVADDVLNIRSAPDAASSIIGALDHDATAVEVVTLSDNRKWGLVSTGERSGWVSMRFMTQQPGVDPYVIPRPLSCGGTEPFWTLTLGMFGDLFERLGDPAVPLTPTNQVIAFPGFAIMFTDP